MAVFLENVCKFDKCGKVFPTLSHLIIHIEDTHINYDALVPKASNTETSPYYVPLSYILKYQCTANDNMVSEIKEETALMAKQAAARQNATKARLPVQNFTQNQYCFTENELCESENSSDSLTVEEVASNAPSQNKYNKKRSSKDPKDKPFACAVPGCHKRYKNINGIKYHIKNGHKNTNQPVKQYHCVCGKSFKSLPKLNAHSSVCVEKHVKSDLQRQRRLGPYGDMAYYPETALYYGASGDNVVVESNEAHLYEVPSFGDYGELDSALTPYGNIYSTPKKALF